MDEHTEPTAGLESADTSRAADHSAGIRDASVGEAIQAALFCLEGSSRQEVQAARVFLVEALRLANEGAHGQGIGGSEAPHGEAAQDAQVSG